MIAIRRAGPEDADAASALLIASITALCTLDHRGDAAAIAAWTANKSPAGVRDMLARPETTMLVAERDGTIAAVGAVSNGSEITLNYVHPAHRFHGVSRALLAAMEQTMRDAGTAEGRLKSTATARRFYRTAGWIETAPRYRGRFIEAWPMTKVL